MIATCFPAHAGRKNDITELRLGYSRASKHIDEVLWGIRTGDLDGDKVSDIVLLKRHKVRIGKLDGDGFKETAACGWPGDAEGTKLYLMDLDNDGDDEMIISAVNLGHPASMVLDYEDGKCQTIVRNTHMSLRVLGPEKKLVGQSWSSDEYFSGAIFEMILAKGKLKRASRLKLPWRTRLYQFTLEPAMEGAMSVVTQKGRAHLEIMQRVKKRFKRIWRSREKFGGSINTMPAESRRVMGSEKSAYVAFDVPPIIFQDGSDVRMVAVYHDMPLREVVGRHPYIRGAEIVGFRRDPALGFTEKFRTVRLPGAVVDYHIDNKGENGAKRLLVLLQEGAGFFMDDRSSIIFTFDLPAPSD